METTKEDVLISRYAYIKQIMYDMKNGVLALDKTGNVVYSNPQMNSIFEKTDLEGQTVNLLMYEHENPANDDFWDVIMDVIQGHEIHYQKRVSYTAPSGRRYSLHLISSYLSAESEGVVITVSDETEYDVLVQKKHDATIVLICMLLLVCVTALVTELHVFVEGSFPHSWIARCTEIMGFIMLLLFLKYTSLTVNDFGVLPVNLKKELMESFLLIGVMVSGMVAAKAILMAIGSDLFPENKPFFDLRAFPPFYFVEYLGIVLLQEFQTKCGLQKSITRVLDLKYANVLAVFVTSVLFMALHVQHGLVFMMGAGVMSAILAVLYGRHNSLLGCSMVHYVFGILGLILGWVTY